MLDYNLFKTFHNYMQDQYSDIKSDSIVRFDYELLKDISDDDFKKGIQELIKTRKYKSFPTIAEIIECCTGKISDKAIIACDELCRALTDCTYPTIEFEDKIIHMCIENLGGLSELSSMGHQEMIFMKKEFIKLYEVFSKHPRETKPYFIGYHDGENGKVENLLLIKCNNKTDENKINTQQL
ncbi:MAG: hypothetical protein ACJA0H_002342, partial [Francisellaceae bacterium]